MDSSTHESAESLAATDAQAAVQALISTEAVGRHYRAGQVDALSGVTLKILPADYVSIVGKSGSGKTTLLNLIGGLDHPTSGRVRFMGEPLTTPGDLDRHRARHVGFVFQTYYLLPNLTAIENVQIPLFGSELDASARLRRATDLLARVNLAGRENHLPAQLSGGECQRVAIARALAARPPLILADEPTGALDSESGELVLDLLEQLNREDGITLIVVTHDESVAARADRQIRLQDGRLQTAS